MAAMEFFANVLWVAPALLALVIFAVTARPRAAQAQLLFALLLTCYGSFGIVSAVHIAISSTPLRLILHVPDGYAILTYNIETFFKIVIAMGLAVFVATKNLIPSWPAFIEAQQRDSHSR